MSFKRKAALELGLLICSCGHRNNNHFDHGTCPCAHCDCKEYQETINGGRRIVENASGPFEENSKEASEVKFLRDRERDICKAVGEISDGGKYRNDVIEHLRMMFDENKRFKERLQIDPSGTDKIDELTQAMAELQHRLDSVEKDNEYYRKVINSHRGILNRL